MKPINLEKNELPEITSKKSVHHRQALNIVLTHTITQDSSSIVNNKNHRILKDTNLVASVSSNRNDTLIPTSKKGNWLAEAKIPVEKKSFGKKLLGVAASCLRGLHLIGVKKADAVKQVNPDNGNTDYILVLGNRSYSTGK
jgi:hypothetical protein